jgi:hypothetical protein
MVQVFAERVTAAIDGEVAYIAPVRKKLQCIASAMQ